MGQQQILIAILVVIIVALGVALALQIFQTSYVNFEEDKFSQILIDTGEEFQVAYEKPEMLGGGGKQWPKVNFNVAPCTFGEVRDAGGKVCRSEDGSFIVLSTDHTNYKAIKAMARIGGKGLGDLYTRELFIYADSLVFVSDWIAH